jgi:hypothetical protein
MDTYPSKVHQFTSTNQPKNNGRKPSKLREYLKANNLSALDIQIIASNLLNLSIEELAVLQLDKSKPILITGSARAFLKDFKNGRKDVIEWLINRGFGKAIERCEIKGTMDITTMTPEQRKARLDELERKRHERETESKVPGAGGEVSADTNQVQGE